MPRRIGCAMRNHPCVISTASCSSAAGPARCAMSRCLVAIGVNERGYREILGICKEAKENKTGWSAFLKQLKERGLKGVRLITSDACIGLAESAVEFFLKGQRCVVHIFSHVPRPRCGDRGHAQGNPASEDLAAAREKANR